MFSLETKKKAGYGALLLVLLFTMLLGICSTCYAEDNIWLLDDSDYFEWYYDYLLNNSNLNSTYKTRIQNIGKSSFGASFYNAWNSAMINKGFSNCLYTNCAIISRQTSSNLAFLLILHNAGSPGVLDLGFLYLWGDYVYGTYPNSGNIYLLKITIDSNGNIISNNTFETVSNTSSGSSQGSYSFNDDHSVLTLQNSGFAGIPQGYTKSDYINGNAQTVIFSSIGGNFIPSDSQPENPSGDSSGDIGGNTGTITNPSGDITGNIDLSGIENGITNINNNLNNIENKIPSSGEIQSVISGEVGKITETLTVQPNLEDTTITSGDIENALGFTLESDRYANFWLQLTNGLKNALLGEKRTIEVSFQNRSWTIDLDNFAVLPAWLKIIVMPFSTCFFTWILVRWWKLIIDKLSSGNVDALLKENSEEGISNLL